MAEAFQNGQAAYRDGRPIGDNPYPKGTEVYYNFIRGWQNARRQAEQYL